MSVQEEVDSRIIDGEAETVRHPKNENVVGWMGPEVHSKEWIFVWTQSVYFHKGQGYSMSESLLNVLDCHDVEYVVHADSGNSRPLNDFFTKGRRFDPIDFLDVDVGSRPQEPQYVLSFE